MSLSMLLDVLVLGHLCVLSVRDGGVGALSGVAPRSPLSRCSRLLSQRLKRALVLLPLVHAYAIAVVTSYVRCTSGQASSVRGKDTACRRAIIED